ncbi:MAG: tRNA epoxyqueuosine(34) reductase QueG [Pseudomonadota bacterium]|nr:tRNA epoxyqueuosine(34) reductase QueG [Pseudomonadota bacterium]
MTSIKDRIRREATAMGFDAVGFAAPDLGDHVQQGLTQFLAQGHHGNMAWMADKADRRADPRTLWPEVKSIIVLGHNYAPAADPMRKLSHRDKGVISCYALNRDYHDVIKKKLKALARWLAEAEGCEVKVFVDTAPVMEKPLAEAAELGWQGKHTCLVSREFGSWLFLGSIFTTLSLENLLEEGTHFYEPGSRRASPQNRSVAALREDSRRGATTRPAIEMRSGCGTCTRCLDICPTQAFTAEHQLDARRCIAYLTIEHKGQIPLEFRKAIGNRIYGCDDCLAVCPWNKFAQTSKEAAYHARKDLESPSLRQLAALDDAAFRALFAGSPVKRIGRDRFVRNVLVAIGNSGDASLADAADALLNDPSPLVAEMAAWAVSQLPVHS